MLCACNVLPAPWTNPCSGSGVFHLRRECKSTCLSPRMDFEFTLFVQLILHDWKYSVNLRSHILWGFVVGQIYRYSKQGVFHSLRS